MGSGNVAMGCLRTAKRLGADEVILATGAGKQAALGIQDWLAKLARGEVANPKLA